MCYDTIAKFEKQPESNKLICHAYPSESLQVFKTCFLQFMRLPERCVACTKEDIESHGIKTFGFSSLQAIRADEGVQTRQTKNAI